MRIKTIISQYRRDFTADYECEHCNHIERKSGYDDYNFHHNVIPKMVCKNVAKLLMKIIVLYLLNIQKVIKFKGG